MILPRITEHNLSKIVVEGPNPFARSKPPGALNANFELPASVSAHLKSCFMSAIARNSFRGCSGNGRKLSRS
jgi:hypothetical protein